MAIAMRKCVGCGSRRPKAELVRVGSDPWTVTTGVVKLCGRGVYLCPARGCVEKARTRGNLERTLGARVPDEVYRQIEMLVKESHKNWQTR